MNATDTTEDALTLRQLLAILRARWMLVTGSALGAAILGFTIGLVMHPVYRSTVLLMPVQSTERQGLLGSMLGNLGSSAGLISSLGFGFGNETATTEALAVLQSREFIEEFIRSHNLMPVLYADKWDPQAGRWKADVTPPTSWKAYKLFTRDIMDVSQDKKTNLVTLHIDWTDRLVAAAWANDLVERVNARLRGRAMSDADDTIRYLEQELKNAEAVEIRTALFNMIESQLKIKSVATVRKQYVFKVLDAAAPSDFDVRLRPHKAIYAITGLVIGSILGASIAVLAGAPRRTPRGTAAAVLAGAPHRSVDAR
jgi:LPS O-antigen subunit length determinant protein (WzzB/FepE family)